VRTTKTQTDDNDGDVASNGEYPTHEVPLRHYSMTPHRSAVDRQKVEKKKLRGSVCCLLPRWSRLACRRRSSKAGSEQAVRMDILTTRNNALLLRRERRFAN